MSQIDTDRAAGGNTGSKSSIGTTAVQLTSTATVCSRGVTIIPDSSNSGTVYVGFSSAVTANAADGTTGVPLPANGIFFFIDDLSKIYLIGSASGQKVFYVGQ